MHESPQSKFAARSRKRRAGPRDRRWRLVTYFSILGMIALVFGLAVASVQLLAHGASLPGRTFKVYGAVVLFVMLVGMGLTALMLYAQRQRREFDRRRTHGLCPQCGYDRASLERTSACPECGHEPREASQA